MLSEKGEKMKGRGKCNVKKKYNGMEGKE